MLFTWEKVERAYLVPSFVFIYLLFYPGDSASQTWISGG